MSIRRSHRGSSSQSSAKLDFLRNKAAKLREKVKAGFLAAQERREARVAWWQRAFRTPLVGFYGWVFSRASSLWAAYLTLLGWNKSPRTSLAKRHGQVKRGKHIKHRRINLEGLEQRQLLAADITAISPGTFTEVAGPATDTAVTNTADPSVTVTVSSASSELQVDHDQDGFVDAEDFFVTGSTSYTFTLTGWGAGAGDLAPTSLSFYELPSGSGLVIGAMIPGTADDSVTISVDTVDPATPPAPDLAPSSDTGSSTTDNETMDSTPTFAVSTSGFSIGDKLELLIDGSATGVFKVLTAGDFSPPGVISLTAPTVGTDGPHSAAIRATDPASNSVDGPTLAWTLDTVLPTVATAPDSTPTNAATATFTATFTDASTVSNVTADDFALTTSGIAGASITMISGSGNGPYTVTVNTGTGDGTIRLDLKGTTDIEDVAGNAPLAYTGGALLTVDKTAPTLTVTSDMGTGGDIINIGDVATITFTLDEPGSYTGMGVSVSSGMLGAVMGGPTMFTASYTPAAGFDGTATVTVVAGAFEDAASNDANGSTLDLDVDTIAPTVAFTRDDANPTNADSVDFSIDFSEPVVGFIPGGTVDFVSDITGSVVVGSGSGSGSGATYTGTASGITGDGTLGINILPGNNITDLAGNPLATPETTDEVYTIDNTEPTSTITFPGSPFAFNETSWTDAITGTASDPVTPMVGGVASGAVEVDVTIEQVGTPSMFFDDGTMSFSSLVPVAITVPVTAGAWSLPFADSLLSEGTYTIEVKARDAAGNVESTSTVTFVYDVSEPTVTVDTLSTFNHTPTLTGTYTDLGSPPSGVPAGGILVDVGPHMNLVATLSAPGASSGTWSVAVPFLADGVYDVVATVTDVATNSAVDTTTDELSVYSLSVEIEATDSNPEEGFVPAFPDELNGQYTVRLATTGPAPGDLSTVLTSPLKVTFTISTTAADLRYSSDTATGDFTMISGGPVGSVLSGLPADPTTLSGAPHVGAMVTIPVGSSSARIDLKVTDDLILDPAEDITLTLTATDNVNIGLDPSPTPPNTAATLVILDDEAGAGVTLSVMATDPDAAEAPIFFDMSSVFNADIIYNNSSGASPDLTQDSFDAPGGAMVYSTDSGVAGPGLPDDGVFPATAFSPEIQLNYRDTDNGDNAWLALGGAGPQSVTVPVIPGSYATVDILHAAAAAASPIPFSVTFNFTSGPSFNTPSKFSPDWADDFVGEPTPAPGAILPGVESSDLYYLINGMNRTTTGGAIDGAFPLEFALFGTSFALPAPGSNGPGSYGTLESFTVNATPASNFAMLGAFGTAAAMNMGEYTVKLRNADGDPVVLTDDLTVTLDLSGSANPGPVIMLDPTGGDYDLSGAAVDSFSPGAKTVTVTIPAGSSEVTIKLTAHDDMIIEPTETATATIDPLSLSSPTPAIISFITPDLTPADVDIVDNDMGLADIEATLPSAGEPNTDGKVTVTLEKKGTAATGPTVSSTDTYVPVIQSGSASTDTQTVGATVTDPDYQTGIDEVESNDTFATAQRVDGYWNTNPSPYIADATTVPHNIVFGSGDGSFDYYSFVIESAGQTATFDIDFSSGFDAHLQILDTDGSTVLASNDDNAGGDPGSPTVANTDALVSHTFVAPGTYFVRVSHVTAKLPTVMTAAVPSSSKYQLNASITGHQTGALIPAGQTMTMWKVDVLDDDPSLIEPNETATFTLGTPVVGDPDIMSSEAAATVDIADDDVDGDSGVVNVKPGVNPGVEVLPTGTNVDATFVFNLDEDDDGIAEPIVSSTDTVVKFMVDGLLTEATYGEDYIIVGATSFDTIALMGTMTIPAGSSSATLTVKVLNDDIVEDDEDVVIKLVADTSAPVHPTGLVDGDVDITLSASMGSATVTILDEDIEKVTINSGLPAIEGIQKGELIVGFLNGKTADTDTVLLLQIMDGTATLGPDFTIEIGPNVVVSTLPGAMPGDYLVTIPAGSTSVTVLYDAPTDFVIEPNEMFTAKLASPIVSGDTDIEVAAPTANMTVGNIIDNDGAFVKIEAIDDVVEGDPPGPGNTESFRIFLVKKISDPMAPGYGDPVFSQVPIVVTFGVGGTATAGVDYETITPTSVTIPGTVGTPDSDVLVDVTTIPDDLADFGETVVLTLSGAAISPPVSPPGIAGRIMLHPDPVCLTDTMTIIDDDAVTVTVDTNPPGDMMLQEGFNDGAVVVRLSGPVSNIVNVQLMVTHTGTATLGSDFDVSTFDVTFQPGEIFKVIPVTVIDDAIPEGAETIHIAVKNMVSADPQVSVPLPVAPVLDTDSDLTGEGVSSLIKWNSTDGGNDHWYVLVSAASDDFEAYRAAAENSTYQGVSGKLATFTAQDEWAFVRDNLLGATPAFAGGTAGDGSLTGVAGPGMFQWITNEDWVFGTTTGVDPWDAGQPDDDPGALTVTGGMGGLWSSESLAYTTTFAIFEFEGPASTMGMLAAGDAAELVIKADPQLEVITPDNMAFETNPALPDDDGVFRIQLRQDEPGFENTVANDLIVKYILRGEAVEGTDYDPLLPPLVHEATILAGESGVDVIISALDDPIIENNEKVWIQVVGTMATGNDVDITVESNLYSIADSGGALRQIDPDTGATIGSPITIVSNPMTTALPGAVSAGRGLAVNPLTGEMYALVQIGSTTDHLIRIDSISGGTALATYIGSTGETTLIDIAFGNIDASGNGVTLYAVSDAGSDDTLYTLDLTSGDATSFDTSLPTVAGAGEAIALGDPAAGGPLYRIAGSPESFRTYNPATGAGSGNIGGFGGGTQGKVTALTWNYAGGNLYFADADVQNGGGGSSTEFFRVTTGGAVTFVGNMNHTAEGLAYFHQMVTIKDNDAGIIKVAATDDKGFEVNSLPVDDGKFTVSLVHPVTGLPITSDSDTEVTFNVMGDATPFLGNQTATSSSLLFPQNIDSYPGGDQEGALHWSLNGSGVPFTVVDNSVTGGAEQYYEFTVLNDGDNVSISSTAGTLKLFDGGIEIASGASINQGLPAGTYIVEVTTNSAYTLTVEVENHPVADYELTSDAANQLSYDTGTGMWSAIIPALQDNVMLVVDVLNDTQVEFDENVDLWVKNVMGDSDIYLGGSAWSIDDNGQDLNLISTGDGATIAEVPIVNGAGIEFGDEGRALARNPITGQLFAVLQDTTGPNTEGLYTVNPVTGLATLVGALGDEFDAIAFDSFGILYGITDEDASLPNSLFQINPFNAATFVLTSVSPSSFSHTLAFNPDDGLLYHLFGGDDIGSNLHLETINPFTLAIVNVPLSGDDLGDDPQALAYEGNGSFKIIDDNPGLYSLTLIPGGAVIQEINDDIDDFSDGMVILQPMMLHATVVICDNDEAEVYVSATDDSNPEGVDDGSITFSLRDKVTGLPISAGSPVTFTYSIGGTAINGADYALLSGTATIPANASSVTVVVDSLADSLAELTETVEFEITSLSPAVDPEIDIAADPDDEGVVNIVDNDTAEINLTVSDMMGSEQGPSDPAVFNFTMTAPGAGVPVTVNFMLDPAAATPHANPLPNGVLNPFADYTLSSPTIGSALTFDPNTGMGSITFAPGITSVLLRVNPINDNTVEGDEWVGIKIVPPLGPDPIAAGVSIGSDVAAEVKIKDNDTALISIVGVSDAVEDPAATPPGDGIDGLLEVRLSKPVEHPVTVEIMYTGAGTMMNPPATIGLPGIPDPAADFESSQVTLYPSNKGFITFLPGEVAKPIDVSPTPQAAMVEDDETVEFMVSSLVTAPSGVTISPTEGSDSILIIEEFFDITLEVDDSIASEDGSMPTDAGSFNIRISSPSAADTIVKYMIERTGTTNPFARVGQPTISEVEPNQSGAAPHFTAAQDLDLNTSPQLFGWSLLADPEVTDSGLTGTPYIRVAAGGDGTFDYFQFTATAGERVILDIDHGFGGAGSTDTTLFLINKTTGALVASSTDGPGDVGSTSTVDPFLDLIIGATDTYVVAVGEAGSFFSPGTGILGNPLDAGDTYTLNVSAGAHATADYAAPLGLVGPDFTMGFVTIPAMASFVPVDIDPYDDLLVEGDETFKVTLVSFTGGNGATTLGAHGPVMGEITIEDDDTFIIGGSLLDDPAREPTATPAIPATIVISLPPELVSTDPIVVRLKVSGSAEVPDTSVVGMEKMSSDYTLSSTATFVPDTSTVATDDYLITIPAGASSVEVTITPKEDNLIELEETVTITPTAIFSGDMGGLIEASGIGITAHIENTDAAKVVNASVGADLSGAEPGGGTLLAPDIHFLALLNPAGASEFGVTSDADVTLEWMITGFVAGDEDHATPWVDYEVMAVPGKVTVDPFDPLNPTVLKGTVTIAAHTPSTKIPVKVLNDDIIELPESLSLTLKPTLDANGRDVMLGDGTALEPLTQTAVIADDTDTGEIKIEATTPEAKEAGLVNGVFRVSQSKVSTTDTVVRIVIDKETGSDPETTTAFETDPTGPLTRDFTVVTNANVVKDPPGSNTTIYTITIPAGSTFTDVVIKPDNNPENEPLEFVVMDLVTKLSGDDQLVLSSMPSMLTDTVTIEDDDAVKFTVSSVMVTEGDTVSAMSSTLKTMRFTVSMDRVVQGVDVTVNTAFTDITANKGPDGHFVGDFQDYDGTTTTLTFMADGASAPVPTSSSSSSPHTTATFEVTIFDDGASTKNGSALDLVEATETFLATLTIDGTSLAALAGRGVDLSMNTHEATIKDNDKATIKVSDDEVNEDDGPAEFEVTLVNANDPMKPVAVDTDLTVDINYLDDTALGDDLSPTVPFGADFENDVPGQVTIAAGSSSVVVVDALSVVIVEDTIVEGGTTDSPGSEQFTADPSVVENIGDRNIMLMPGTGTIVDASIGEPEVADMTIVSISMDDGDSLTADDDLASEPGRTDGNATFKITMTDPSSSDTVITFTMSGDASAVPQVLGGPPAFPADYTLVLDPAKNDARLVAADLTFNPVTRTGTIRIPASGVSVGDTPLTMAFIDLVPLDDDSVPGTPFEGDGLVEDDELAMMTLTGFASADPNVKLAVGPADQSATATIIDDDDATVSISTTGANMAVEGGMSGVVTATLSNKVDEDVIVRVDRLASSVAKADGGLDADTLSVFPAFITIPAGSLTGTLIVSAIDDSTPEGNEDLNLQATAVTNNADVTIGSPDTATITFKDNGDGLFVSIDVGASDLLAHEEGQEPGFFIIQLTDGAGNRVTVPAGGSVNVIYDIFSGSTATSDDYVGAIANNVTIAAGFSEAKVQITPVDDTIVENPNEILKLTIQSGTGGGTFAGAGIDTGDNATPALPIMEDIEIVDNDGLAPQVEAIVINNDSGNLVQRSQIKSVAVKFDSIVTLLPGAFTVEQRSDASPGAPPVGTVGGVIVSPPDNSSGKSVVTLTFTPNANLVDAAGSLADGNYQVTIDPTKVLGTGAVPLVAMPADPTGGDMVFGDEATDAFYRMFGDGNGVANAATGEAFVDLADFVAIRTDVLSLNYDDYFDQMGDGFVDISDYNEVRSRVMANKTRNLGGF